MGISAEIKSKTLDISHIRFDLIMYYKICHGPVAINHSDHLKYSNFSSLPTRSGGPQLVTPVGRSNKLLKNFFFCHIHLWNSLPPAVTNAHIFSFKNVYVIDLSHYLKGYYLHHFTITAYCNQRASHRLYYSVIVTIIKNITMALQ